MGDGTNALINLKRLLEHMEDLSGPNVRDSFVMPETLESTK